MTHTDGTPPPAGPIYAAHTLGAWDACDHCQAPLDERQRYCVVCGARHAQSDDPVAGWFVANARRARAAEAAPPPDAGSPPPWRSSSVVLAIALALLPVVAAIGVTVGRGETGDSAQLVKALQAQQPPVVNVIGGGGSAGGAVAGDTADAGTADASSGSAARGKRSAAKVRGDNPDDADGRVIARTRYGTARQLTDSRVTPEQAAESREALRHIVESQGRDYVDQQRNLPDQIVIP
ncbi:zinc ribbon domain-containing protein [Conexibacter sp. CPCC 206217]|uniref:zinc ribbon domain-containing protein n=1 Tax=Conexibacter sp. CPCC 206217 TaxID=3064574 RepID=UPI002722E828|nr:zinc ribbon domain-containing protein [Conexibacter sp. CPCC 206217]MDO8211061.1 zinc ribbon domain-containing protein [Conexibacter sp. CPCC 206217]